MKHQQIPKLITAMYFVLIDLETIVVHALLYVLVKTAKSFMSI